MSQDSIFEDSDKQGHESEQRLADAWSSILSHRNGRRVIHDLLQICQYGLSPFEGDTNMCVFTSGKQKVAEYVMGMVSLTDPHAYFLMIKEAKEDKDYDDNRNSSSPST